MITKKNSGFTLLEILVVVAIIGLLVSIIFASLAAAKEKALVTKALVEMEEFSSMAVIAQAKKGRRIRDILPDPYGGPDKPKYDWPDGPCYGIDLRNIPSTDPCYVNWMDVASRIQAATKGVVVSIENLERDPWGSPYLFDPNEGEPALPTYPGPCDRKDVIKSAGPNGVIDSPYDDEIFIEIPFSGNRFDANSDGIADSSCE